SVSFGWANGQVSQVTDPAGNIYRYTYTPNVFGKKTTVRRPTTPRAISPDSAMSRA
ncbi:hypothetical protein C7E14_22825, partial [Stenotrophomonas maltophilia]